LARGSGGRSDFCGTRSGNSWLPGVGLLPPAAPGAAVAAAGMGRAVLTAGSCTLSARYLSTAAAAGLPSPGDSGRPPARSAGLATIRPRLLAVAQPSLLSGMLVKSAAAGLLQFGQRGNVTR